MARLLIVDDDEADRVVLRTILERADHEVFEAKDGQEALQELTARAIDLVVTDLQMPEVHGLELISILRDFAPRPSIIAISGTGEFQLDIARAVGATRTLTKPVMPADLLQAVDEALQSGA